MIVGRDADLERLANAFDESLAGAGRLALISGEAGIGKTTLTLRLIHEARRKIIPTLIGHSYDLAPAPPYALWDDVLRAVGRASSQVNTQDSPDVVDQATLFARALDELRAACDQQPLLIVLEDLHWSDRASLDLLRFVTRRLAGLRVLVVATYRDELTPAQPLFQLLPSIIREAQPLRVQLRRLSHADVTTLIARRYQLPAHEARRLAGYAHERSDGNPFFLHEILLALEYHATLQSANGAWRLGTLAEVELPTLIQQVVEQRLARLSERSRELLELAALIGDRVPLSLWEQAADASEQELSAALGEALEAGLLREVVGHDTLRFTHTLVRETLDAGALPSTRRARHQRIALALATAIDSDPSTVAHHFDSAGDPASALEWRLRAGRQALERFAPQLAIEQLSLAIESFGKLGRAVPPAALLDRAAAFEMAGDFPRARADLQRALDLSRMAQERESEWHALIALGHAWTAGDYQQVGRYHQQALELARALDNAPLVAHSLNHLGNWRANRDEVADARALHTEALGIFEALDDRRGLAETLDLLAMAGYLAGDLAASAGYGNRALELFRQLDDRARVALSLVTLTCAAVGAEAVRPADSEVTRAALHQTQALAAMRELGWRAGEALILFLIGESHSAAGEVAEAEATLARSYELAREVGHQQWAIAASAMLAIHNLRVLDPQRAIQVAEPALAEAEMSGSLFWTRVVASVLAAALAELGAPEAGLRVIDEVAPESESMLSQGLRYCWWRRAEITLRLGQPERALAMVDELIASATPGPSLSPLPDLWLLRGDALLALQQTAEALPTLQLGRQRAVQTGQLSIIWRLDISLGAAEATLGRRSEAEACFGRARALIEALTATFPDSVRGAAFRERTLALVDGRAQEHAVSPALLGLTPRELDVLRLLTAGYSDRAIADALELSPRTISTHVNRIFTKLEVGSRAAAAASAVRHGLA